MHLWHAWMHPPAQADAVVAVADTLVEDQMDGVLLHLHSLACLSSQRSAGCTEVVLAAGMRRAVAAYAAGTAAGTAAVGCLRGLVLLAVVVHKQACPHGLL